MTLENFETELRAFTAKDQSLRPFVCDGSPLVCKIFIVGTNPVTEVPFWPFWSPGVGFDKQAWLQHYEHQRVSVGKRRRSPTRNMLEAIVSAASPQYCLETNVFSTPSPRASDLAKGDRQTRIFEFLLRTIRPSAVHLHGPDARAVLQRLCDCELELNQPTRVRSPFGVRSVLATHHLAYQWSYARAAAVGEWLAAEA